VLIAVQQFLKFSVLTFYAKAQRLRQNPEDPMEVLLPVMEHKDKMLLELAPPHQPYQVGVLLLLFLVQLLVQHHLVQLVDQMF
jgi:hypothetical protein